MAWWWLKRNIIIRRLGSVDANSIDFPLDCFLRSSYTLHCPYFCSCTSSSFLTLAVCVKYLSVTFPIPVILDLGTVLWYIQFFFHGKDISSCKFCVHSWVNLSELPLFASDLSDGSFSLALYISLSVLLIYRTYFSKVC